MSKCPRCDTQGVCQGGTFLDCQKRHKRASVIAGVLDTYGGLRFVVSRKRDLKYHYRPTESLIVVPNFFCHEPVAWGHIPVVIRMVTEEVEAWCSRQDNTDDPYVREAVTMYRLRCLENPVFKRALNLEHIVET